MEASTRRRSPAADQSLESYIGEWRQRKKARKKRKKKKKAKRMLAERPWIPEMQGRRYGWGSRRSPINLMSLYSPRALELSIYQHTKTHKRRGRTKEKTKKKRKKTKKINVLEFEKKEKRKKLSAVLRSSSGFFLVASATTGAVPRRWRRQLMQFFFFFSLFSSPSRHVRTQSYA